MEVILRHFLDLVMRKLFNAHNRKTIRQVGAVATPSDSQCEVGQNGEVNYESADHGHIVVMVSLSEETIDMDPFTTLETFASSLISSGVDSEQFSLVSYDGQKQLYQPFFMTMDNHVSNNIQAFQSVINGLEFNGPSFDTAHTKSSLAELVQTLNYQPGALKRIVLLSPEISNPASLIDSSTQETLRNQLTEVYFISNSDINEERVFKTHEVNDLAAEITRNLRTSLRRRTECACQKKSQEITTTCRFV